MIDKIKLYNALDFVQGFIRPVSVVYSEVIKEHMAIVGDDEMIHGPIDVSVRVSNRNSMIDIRIFEGGGILCHWATMEACKMATDYLDGGK